MHQGIYYTEHHFLQLILAIVNIRLRLDHVHNMYVVMLTRSVIMSYLFRIVK